MCVNALNFAPAACNKDAGNFARPLEPPRVSGKTKWIVGLVGRTQISEPRICVKFISDLN